MFPETVDQWVFLAVVFGLGIVLGAIVVERLSVLQVRMDAAYLAHTHVQEGRPYPDPPLMNLFPKYEEYFRRFQEQQDAQLAAEPREVQTGYAEVAEPQEELPPIHVYDDGDSDEHFALDLGEDDEEGDDIFETDFSKPPPEREGPPDRIDPVT